MHKNDNSEKHVKEPVPAPRSLRQLFSLPCLVILLATTAPTALAAPSCDLLPMGSLQSPNAADSAVPGIVPDPVGNLNQAHRTTRIVNTPSANANIPGGQSSAVAADGRMFRYNQASDPDSHTGGTSEDLSNLVSDANTSGVSFVAAHLAHHLFNGNHGGENNFSVTTHNTNQDMKNHGEKVALDGMHEIARNYYDGKKYKEEFVGYIDGNFEGSPTRLYYKPGIKYQTTADPTTTVYDYDNPQTDDSLKLMPNVPAAYTQQMSAELNTKITFIIHEYAEVTTVSARGTVRTDYKPTGKWYYMNQAMFTDLRSKIFPSTYALPANGTHNLPPRDIGIEVVGNGREITFTYFNAE